MQPIQATKTAATAVLSAAGSLASDDNSVMGTAKRAAKRFVAQFLGASAIASTPLLNIAGWKAAALAAAGSGAGVIMDRLLKWSNS